MVGGAISATGIKNAAYIQNPNPTLILRLNSPPIPRSRHRLALSAPRQLLVASQLRLTIRVAAQSMAVSVVKVSVAPSSTTVVILRNIAERVVSRSTVLAQLQHPPVISKVIHGLSAFLLAQVTAIQPRRCLMSQARTQATLRNLPALKAYLKSALP